MARKSASGDGTIRKKTVTRSGKDYTYWEARYTVGTDPGTGKQIQRSITGKTQKEVAQKLKAATRSIDTGTYTAPCKMTVGEWLDIWIKDYLGGVKPTTVSVYKNNINRHIKPALGATALSGLYPHTIQCVVNGLELSPSSVQLAYKVLYQALKKAVQLEYILKNPADGCVLPKREQKEIHPLDDMQTTTLIGASSGSHLELLITIALFTGLRQSELLGLTWDCIDFSKGYVLINKQLTRKAYRNKSGVFCSPKNGKSRTIAPASSVMATIKTQKVRQSEMKLRVGSLWGNDNNLVFTDDTGGPLEQWWVEKGFRAIVQSIGMCGTRFHDLRHTYAVNSIRAGDDIKSIQGNLGHSSAAFTLDRYGHFTERMKQDSAARMEGFMRNVLNL